MAQRRTAVQSVNLNCVTDTDACHGFRSTSLDLDGSIEEPDCKLSFRRGGKTLAVATIGRDRESLKGELAMSELSRLVRPDHPLRQTAASSKEAHWSAASPSYLKQPSFFAHVGEKPVFTLRESVFHRRCFA